MREHLENHMLSAARLELHYGGRQPRKEGGDAMQAACAATEQRLYRVTLLRERVEDDREELMVLESGELEMLGGHDVVRGMPRGNVRRSPHEIRHEQMTALRSRLAVNERELRRIQAALSCIAEDPYYLVIELKYFKRMREVDVAQRLKCDPATSRRNRARLIKRLAVRLYGLEEGEAC